jgi:hypothetical protein
MSDIENNELPEEEDDKKVDQPTVEDLLREKSALSATVQYSQQQLEKARADFEAERKAFQVELDNLRKQQTESFDPRSVLTPEERELIDENYIVASAKIAKAAWQQERQHLQQEFEKQQAKQQEMIRGEFLRAELNSPGSGLEDFGALASDPKFDAWLKSDEGFTANTLLNQLVSAPIGEIPKLVKRTALQVKKYRGDKEPPRSEDPGSRFAQHVSRNPGGPQEIGPDVMRKVKQLAASRNPADRAKAKELLSRAA